MGFWRKFKNFVKKNANKNVEPISKSFGAMTIIWASALIHIAISFVTGQPLNIGVSIALGLGGTLEFLIILIRSVFGKKKEE